MKIKNAWTKGLAIAGTVLVWFPVLAPTAFAIGSYLQGRVFRFDYMMPAELFPAVLVGSGLLLVAALLARSRRLWIGVGLALAIGFLVATQALAVATGLASGAHEATGWRWTLVLGLLILYDLTVVAIGVGGVALLRDLFRPARAQAATPDTAP